MLEEKQYDVAIIGLGYVGIPLAMKFSLAGKSVLGIDVNHKKCQLLNSGHSTLSHIDDSIYSKILKKGFVASTEHELLSSCSAIIFCVPTPLDTSRNPDLSFIRDALQKSAPFMKKGQLISLESTTYPGTTSELVKPVIESMGLNIGSDIFLVYSPEREDPGNDIFNISNTPKLVGGITDSCLKKGISLYKDIVETIVPVSSTEVAEMSKLFENIFRMVNIGLVNEMKLICDAMGLEMNEVIDAASTKPFGFMPFRPGPGLGGHCIPIDPFYLSWRAKSFGLSSRFIELAGEINIDMPKFIISKILSETSEIDKPNKKIKILFLGLAYKKNVDDLRESPATIILEMLMMHKFNISYSDPLIKEYKLTQSSKVLKSVKLTRKKINENDLIVLLTDHDEFNYDLIFSNSKKIIDTRNKFPRDSKVISA